MNKTPPLKALQVFCAFGATGSVQDAAAQLGVSSSAVSQQLKNLEEWLGISLVSRNSGNLVLTSKGEVYYNELWQAFSIINNATEAIWGNELEGDLVLSTLPSFAALWLLPRLKLFNEDLPNTNISILTTNEIEKFDGTNVNLSIRFGMGQYLGMKSTKILSEFSNLVCTPTTYKKYFSENIDPRNAPLDSLNFIDDRGLTPHINNSLEQWIESSGRNPFSVKFSTAYSDSQMAINHVINSDSFLLARHSLVRELLRDGELIAPFGAWLKEPASYFIVYPVHRILRPIDKKFIGWLTKVSESYEKENETLG